MENRALVSRRLGGEEVLWREGLGRGVRKTFSERSQVPSHSPGHWASGLMALSLHPVSSGQRRCPRGWCVFRGQQAGVCARPWCPW